MPKKIDIAANLCFVLGKSLTKNEIPEQKFNMCKAENAYKKGPFQKKRSFSFNMISCTSCGCSVHSTVNVSPAITSLVW